MREVQIPKRSGGVRTIVVPSEQEKMVMRMMIPELHKKKLNNAVHGFRPGRSPVTNAMQHVGYDVSICFDLKDFFDEVDGVKLKGKVEQKILDVCLYKGRTAQGLPTSPILANIAATKMDERMEGLVKQLIESRNLPVVYTRYADDLAFSFKGRVGKDEMRWFLKKVKQLVHNCGFHLNQQKTTIQYATSGRREICGIMVDDKRIFPTRRHKMRVRSLEYRTTRLKVETEVNHLHGLKEWCRLKAPEDKEMHISTDILMKMDEAGKILKFYNVPNRLKVVEHVQKELDERVHGHNFSITNDPRYFVCMSQLGVNWASCMKLNGGSHRKGVNFYNNLSGASIAVEWHEDKVAIIHGVKLKMMLNRVLLFQLRNGLKVYTRIYGWNHDELIKWIEDKGYISISSAKSIMRKRIEDKKSYWVVGNVQTSISKPFFDNNISTVQAVHKGRKVKVLTIGKI